MLLERTKVYLASTDEQDVEWFERCHDAGLISQEFKPL
jgi:hypothetical protein